MANERNAGILPAQSGHQDEPQRRQDAGDTLAKRYERAKLWLHLGELVLVVLALATFYFSGSSRVLATFAREAGRNEWGAVSVYVFLLLLGAAVLTSPLSYFGGFSLEHRFNLSNQTFRGWLWD